MFKDGDKMAKKIDRRVRYTKMVLKNSLTELLAEKPVEKITVKEICETADINRGTFYSHYSDQYDLYNSIVDEVLEEIFDRLGDFMVLDENGILDSTTKVYEYIKENAELVKTLLNNGVEYSTEKRIRNVFKEIYLNRIDNSTKFGYTIPVGSTNSTMEYGELKLVSK